MIVKSVVYIKIVLATQDPRKRALQNRAKKERNELMKCTQNGTHSCVSVIIIIIKLILNFTNYCFYLTTSNYLL